MGAVSRQCATQVWIQSVPLHHTLVCTSMANISGEPVNLPDLFCSNRACCLHWSCICTWLPVTAHAPGCQSPQSRLISMKWLEQSLQAAQRQKLVVPAECLVDSRAGLSVPVREGCREALSLDQSADSRSDCQLVSPVL